MSDLEVILASIRRIIGVDAPAPDFTTLAARTEEAKDRLSRFETRWKAGRRA